MRRRLARRFSIIGPENDFSVNVDGRDIDVTDRDFYSNIEYLWSLGDVGDSYEDLCKNLQKGTKLSGTVDATQGWTVKGWVGTVDQQKHIDEDSNIIAGVGLGEVDP